MLIVLVDELVDCVTKFTLRENFERLGSQIFLDKSLNFDGIEIGPFVGTIGLGKCEIRLVSSWQPLLAFG